MQLLLRTEGAKVEETMKKMSDELSEMVIFVTIRKL